VNAHAAPVQLSRWDSQFFGLSVARCFVRQPEDVNPALQWSLAHGVRLLITRCDAADTAAIHQMESAGFLLMDTFVRYRFDLRSKPVPAAGELAVRPFRPGDVSAIREVAASAFQGYIGHFHSDLRLDRARCDQLYVEWAANSCQEKRLADEVLVAELDGHVVAFATLKALTTSVAEGSLFGVHANAQGHGIYRALIAHSLEWCRIKGKEVMEVDSQVNNYSVQRVWQRLGYEIYASGHTFHRWLS